uniref:Uncharacterized protein n=1 Tax=Tetranychus urticae TaxID=32264 RepID=T1KS14_TETUR
MCASLFSFYQTVLFLVELAFLIYMIMFTYLPEQLSCPHLTMMISITIVSNQYSPEKAKFNNVKINSLVAK